MESFAYARATSAEEATRLARGDTMILAGGTELLNWMRLGIAGPGRLVDIGRLDQLRGIERGGDTLRIGALATLNEVGEHPEVLANAPVLAASCLKAASAQLRNRATLGGNVLQKTRCPYFRAEAPGRQPMPWPCNKREPGSGCAAAASGYTRLALFGATEHCVATQPSDPAVALAALDAVVEVRGRRRRRRIPMIEFHLTQREAGGGADTAAIENRLDDELILGYHIPLDDAARGSAYLKVRERESYEYAMVSAAAALAMEEGRIGAVRLALGSVAQKPWRLFAAEAALTGQRPTSETIREALDLDLREARPPLGNEFKIELVRNAAERALRMAGAPA